MVAGCLDSLRQGSCDHAGRALAAFDSPGAESRLWLSRRCHRVHRVDLIVVAVLGETIELREQQVAVARSPDVGRERCPVAVDALGEVVDRARGAAADVPVLDGGEQAAVAGRADVVKVVPVWSRLPLASPPPVAEVEKASESRDRGVGTSEDFQIRLDAGRRDPPARARRPSNCLPARFLTGRAYRAARPASRTPDSRPDQLDPRLGWALPANNYGLTTVGSDPFHALNQDWRLAC